MGSSTPTTIFGGALWAVSMRWTDRLIGVASTLILARLLAPSDFGIIAMASLVAALADVLLDLGVNTALIQNREPTSAHYNTAWTIRLAQTFIVAAVVVTVSPFAAEYFNDHRVESVLQVMAIGVLLSGFENIGVVTFQKEMRFGLDFRFIFSKRIVGFIATIVAAWFLRSYWALVIGTLASRVCGVLLSYQMHLMRPTLSLAKFKELFAISQWILLNNIGNFLNNSLHKILVGRRSGSETMGGYTLADEISAMPSTELLAPLNRVLFPAFVEARQVRSELKRVYLLAQGVQALIVIPMSVGLALVANEVVAVLLGEKWHFTVEFIQILALASVVQAITTSGWYVMLTMGKAKNLAVVTWFQVIAFAACVILIPNTDALLIAWIRLITVFAGLLIAVWMLIRILGNVSLLDIVRTVMRPILGAAAMALVVIFTGNSFDLSPVAMLLLKISVGVISYPAAVLCMWLIVGKPAGAEAYCVQKIGALRRR